MEIKIKKESSYDWQISTIKRKNYKKEEAMEEEQDQQQQQEQQQEQEEQEQEQENTDKNIEYCLPENSCDPGLGIPRPLPSVCGSFILFLDLSNLIFKPANQALYQ